MKHLTDLKLLIATFLVFGVAGIITAHTAVAVMSFLMIPFIAFAEERFARVDALHAKAHPPEPKPTETMLDEHECMCNFL